MYTCREIDAEQKEDVQIEQAKLTKFINVRVALLKGKVYKEGNNAGNITDLRVNINDNLSKINEILALDDS